MEKKLKGICIFFVVLFLIPGIPDPISHLVSWASTEMYIEKNYPDENYIIEDISYNITYGGYSAHVIKEGSKDVSFYIYSETWGRIWNDEYKEVLDGTTTARRISREYFRLVTSLFTEEDNFAINGEGHVSGRIEYANSEWISPKDELDGVYPYYSLNQEKLIPDYEYDVRELGKKHGSLNIDFREENISYKRAAEILLRVKDKMDNAGIGFFAATLGLWAPPGGQDGEAMPDDAVIYIINFPYSEIYPEGLEERIEKSYKELHEYWGEPVTYPGEE